MIATPKGRASIQKLRFQGPVMDQLIRPFMLGEYHKLPAEAMVEGPTGTGKSVGLAALVRMYMRRVPGANLVVIRNNRVDLESSFMQMWEEEVLEPNDPWDRFMLAPHGQKPAFASLRFYHYPNGSKIWLRGINQLERFKSMAFDLIWFMEMTEVDEEHVEGLKTRQRKRANSNAPWRGVIGDVNPEYPQHWANKRAIRGVSTRITTTLRDNPGYYDIQKGEYTKAGAEYRATLIAALSGHRAQRYLHGEWVSASGQILPYDESRHMFHGRVDKRPGRRDRIIIDGLAHPILGNYVEIAGYGASYDWGQRAAGTLQVWAVDLEGRQYLVEEVYHTGKDLYWWGEWAIDLRKKYDLPFIVCDSAAQDTIDHFNRVLGEIGGHKARIAIPCKKRHGNRQESNLEVLVSAFADAADGRPSIYIRKNALAHAPDVHLDKKARSLDEEVPAYIYAEKKVGSKGRAEERADPVCEDHGLDAACYFRVHMLGGRRIKDKIRGADPLLDPRAVMDAHYWKDAL